MTTPRMDTDAEVPPPALEGLDHARLLAVVHVQNEIAASALDADEVMRVVAERAMQITGADAGVVEIVEGDEMVYRAACGTAAGHRDLRLRVETSLSGRAVREGRIMVCEDAGTDPRVDAAACLRVGAMSMICVPLPHRDITTGVLKVFSSRTHGFGDEDVATLALLSSVIGAHLAHAAEYERRMHESRHDPLTDLGNRRAYDERLAKEVARSRRYGHALSLVLLDLDGFKAVNDLEGHPAGDEVLRRVAALLHGTRAADQCFRLGGDEFALLLPDTRLAGAELVASRLAEEVAGAPLATRPVTISYGVAELREGSEMELHESADANLLESKRRR